SIDYLHRRECVNVHFGSRSLYRVEKVAVVVRVKIARQSALHTHFASASLPRFERSQFDFFERVKVSVLLAGRAAERTEAATHEAHVGEVDVSIDDVGDHIADTLTANVIGCKQQRFEFAFSRVSEAQTFIEAKLVSVQRAFKD